MDRLNLFQGGHPFRLDDIKHLQDGVELNWLQYLIAVGRGNPFVLWGAELSVVGPDTLVTDGAIILNGEIIPVEAHQITTVAQTLYWIIEETYSSINPRDYEDATTKNVNALRRGKLAFAATPPLGFLPGDGISFEELSQGGAWQIGDFRMISANLSNFNGSGLGIGRTWRQWAIANGSNGTPDLRGKFIVGFDDNDTDHNAVGKVGGSKGVTLSEAEMPEHKHDVDMNSKATGITMSNNGSHEHSSNGNVRVELGSGGGTKLVPDFDLNTGFNFARAAGTHKHTLTDPQHKHTISESNKGSGNAHENRPPYFTAIIVQKII